jgi:signal transduction histidine kinase
MTLNYTLSLAQAGLAEMRALIFELRPGSLEIEGLEVRSSNRPPLCWRYGMKLN